MSFDWKKTVGKVAPGIATLLGGPLAGMATTALCEMFGIDSKASNAEAQLEQAVKSMTPEQAIQMRKIDNDLTIKLKEAEVDIFRSEVSDKQSARGAHKDSFMPAILTVALAALAMTLVYFVMTSSMANVDKTLVGTVIGYVFSELKQATQYWFGSSFGSQKKTEALSKNFSGR